MPKQKPIRTFTLCDANGNEYEINEFKLVAKTSGVSDKNHILTTSQFITLDGRDIDLENDKYYLITDKGKKFQLYDC